jgi:hypothetical protein
MDLDSNTRAFLDRDGRVWIDQDGNESDHTGDTVVLEAAHLEKIIEGLRTGTLDLWPPRIAPRVLPLPE